VNKDREKIILVDDDITNLAVGRNVIGDKYDVFTVPSGAKLFNILEKVKPDLILLDIDMPEMDGYEVIQKIKKNEKNEHIPVIFLSSKNDVESELKGLSLGAVDYMTKPFSPQLLLKHIEIHLLVVSQRKKLEDFNNNLQEMVRAKTQTVFELQNSVLKTVAELVEFKDSITGMHIERTQNYLRTLVDALQTNTLYKEEVLSWDIDIFILSAQLHDVGKIATSDNILRKPGILTISEFEEMKKHTLFGVEIIKKIGESTSEKTFLKHAEILAGTHHEKWDGTGYPHGLRGADIPLQGRLMAIADVYDALVNERPYKKALSHKDAVRIIIDGSGKHFDPYLVNVFLGIEKKFEQIALDYK
jgi:putative two-component system response regulator